MTPGARVAAAIEVLDRIAAGDAPEAALTRWARASRFAGSKDRAAVRDHVFDVVRTWRSSAALGGAETGRGRMIGLARRAGLPLDDLFSGQGHAPAPLSAAERAAGKAPDNLAAAWDLPDWLLPLWQESLGDGAEAAARASQARAPVTLRLRAESALEALTRDGITAQPNRRAARAATVTDGARALRQSRAWADGLVELQDASSQAVVEGIAPSGDGRALDYCAGGGGKALALADGGWAVAAHDADPARMADLPARAARAGVSVDIAQTPQGAFDLVLCDAPCSGSGAWRRAPQGKWALDPARLAALQDMQAAILDAARAHVGPEGTLVYATCSVLRPENEDQVDAFLDRHSGWVCTSRTRWPLDADGDGFFAAHLRQA